jgi:hypothetical protein
MMISYKYLGEALFFLSAAWSIAKWTMRTSVEDVVREDGRTLAELELPDMLPALLARGAAAPEELARMSPAERVAMYYAIVEHEERGEGRRRDGGGWGAVCKACGEPLGAGTVPLGFLVRCPHCDAPLGAR